MPGANEKISYDNMTNFQLLTRTRYPTYFAIASRSTNLETGIHCPDWREEAGMTQYCFNSQEAAQAFVDWLAKHGNLGNVQPKQYQLQMQSTNGDIETSHIVSLPQDKAEALYIEGWELDKPFELQRKILHPRSKESLQSYLSLIKRITEYTFNVLILYSRYEEDLLRGTVEERYIKEYDPSLHAFTTLIARTSGGVLSSYVSKEDYYRDSFLRKAARNLPNHVFLQLIEKLDSETLNQMLLREDKSGFTFFHEVIRYQSDDVVIAVLDKANADQLWQVLSMRDERTDLHTENTLFHSLMSYQSGRAVMAILEKMNAELINKGLKQVNAFGDTPFHLAARRQSADVFIKLLEIASDETIDKVVKQEGFLKRPSSFLSNAAQSQSSRAFKALLDRISVKTILEISIEGGEYALLTLIANYQPVSIFSGLIDRIGSAEWNAFLSAVSLKNLCICLPESVVYRLLKKIHEDSTLTSSEKSKNLRISIKISKKNPGYLTRYIASYLCDRTKWETDKEFLQTLCEAAEPIRSKITRYLCRQFVEGRITAIPVEAATWLLKETKTWQKPTPKRQAFADYLARITSEDSPEDLVADDDSAINCHTALSIATATGDVIALTDDTLAGKIWQDGLASWLDYRLLRQHGDYSIQRILDKLEHADLVLRGTGMPLEPARAALYVETDAEKAFKTGKVLLKVNTEDRWSEFLAMLADYSIRPAEIRSQTEGANWKFHHLRDEITAYEKPDPTTKQADDHQHTKKLSTTYINSRLETRLFRQGDDKSLLVGLAFHIDKSILKCLLSRDSGTVARGWVSKYYNAVENYRDKISDFNYVNFNAFLQAVNEDPHFLNEILAELSREGLLAIVIGRDTPQARKIALNRKQDLLRECKIEVPIIFYNGAMQTVKPYDAEMQYDDSMQDKLGQPYNLLQEQTLKKRLLVLKQKLQEISGMQQKLISFWQKIPPKVQGILSQIDAAERAERNNYATQTTTWRQANDNINALTAQLDPENQLEKAILGVVIQSREPNPIHSTPACMAA